jgi:opacity protein-like surface antigen
MRRFSRAILAGAASLACLASAADAQTIGFKLGASMSKFSIDGETEGFDYTTGLAGGGFIRFDFGRLGIQPEILTITKGAEVDGGAGVDDSAIKIEYVAIPVLIHFPLTYGSSFAPYIFGGPEVAFDIGCEASIGEGDETDCDDDAFGDGPFERKSTDFGLTGGGGLAFAMGPGALLVEGRYTWGLTNIDDNQDPVEIKNRSILLLAGYSIPLGRR